MLRRRRDTATDRPTLMERNLVLEGLVVQGQGTKYSINGTDFVVKPGTWIIGELKAGTTARVKGAKNSDGQLEAASVVVLGAG